MKDILTTIPKVAQWQSIPYAFNFTCQECGCSSIGDIVTKPNLVGWCDTPRGFMMVFECPACFSKFRCHCNTGDKSDKERFENAVYEYICEGEPYLIANAKELYKLLEDETETSLPKFLPWVETSRGEINEACVDNEKRIIKKCDGCKNEND